MAKKSKRAPIVSLATLALTKDMDEAHDYLDKLPETHEWTADELDWLDDLRRSARRLLNVIDACTEEIFGRPVSKN